MQITKLSVKATIATGQYQNIQPEIELSGIDSVDKATDVAMSHIKEMFSKYSEKGSLKENEITISGTKRSFNEDIELQFDPIAHTYHYEGRKLISASEETKKYYKEFDSSAISSVSGKAWGVDSSELEKCWASNGDLTSQLGNVIHKSLEHYAKFQAIGQVISEKKGLDYNYVIPKHPVLKKIIEDYIKIDKDTVGEIIPEALITNVEKGYCGHSDRIIILDKAKKICNVGDFKININSEEMSKDMKAKAPFSELPANKLTKYQIQMSIYANMLQASGWSVNKLIVDVYEDEWKRYELSVLKIIN
jgi:hypothetical protein